MKKQKYKMQEIYQGLYDGPHATPPVSDSGAIFLGISNITPDGHIDYSDIRYINESDLPKWTKRVTPKGGDIVFSYEATLNLYAVIPEGFWGCLGRRMALIRPDESKALGKYLYYYFYSDEWRATIAENTIAGSTVDRIPIAKFPEFRITLPDLSVQKKIAGTLSVYDNLIDNNEKQIKLLEEAAQRLYKEWFVDLHFPGYENCRIVDGLPEGWHKDAVDSKISLLSGYAFKSSDFVDKGQYKIVTIKNVKDGDFDGNNVSLIDEIPLKMPQHCVLEEGDILLSLTGNVGRVCLVYGDNYLLNQRVAKLKSDIPGFAYCLFRSRDMFDEMNNLANGAAQQNLSPIRTGKVEVCFPSDDIIQRFETTVKPMIDQEIELNKMNVVLTEARDRLLPKLMSGEIEV
ncbi:restriction endonuclease subunit S [Bilifractor sp. LCP19S3_H10]|uniref:restriction endonuclease subunit S n=1 Tax=Bilifractor sp. LCP19S3_H10 TaxID=3438736 RepID=UPI003F935D30